MGKLFSGLTTEDVYYQNEQFKKAMELFDKGVIQGLQMLGLLIKGEGSQATVVKRIRENLPKKLDVLIHAPQQQGLDPGQTLDERGIFTYSDRGKNWTRRNKEILDFNATLADEFNTKIVIHPGYYRASEITESFRYVSELFSVWGDIFLLENVPAVIDSSWLSESEKKIFGNGRVFAFGAGSRGMLELQGKLGFRAVLDITHALSTINQVIAGIAPFDKNSLEVQEILKGFLEGFSLPALKSGNVHFSGLTKGSEVFIDRDEDIDTEFALSPMPGIVDFLKDQKVVCLEIPFWLMSTDEIRTRIELFREKYKYY